ncbi:sensor histidine kinase [Roseateles sp. DAIF2]|uniref:sensor histidine kinase n=1 Tax=Roseateles sp. DAIF2 TaxID=2714952 RepID=UPI0018A291EC|nr:histidine kinase [Roseateles sp. DAIF2]QPF74820.1 sensor histidine kinase [Roseateles sp. DAIF2]
MSLLTLRQHLSALPYVLRMGAAILLFSTGIGLFISLLWDQRLWGSIVYSICIGLSCWSLIDGSRLLSARLMHRLFPQREEPRHGWPGWPVMLLCLLVAVPLAYSLGSALADRLLGLRTQSLWDTRWREVAGVLLVSLLASVLATGFFYARGRLAAARTEAEQARRLAAETQLRLLESQLEPHMLFNTLANLRVLIALDAPRAQAMLDRLIAFLRATLNASRSGDEHSLREEFARLADYLALMQERMGARLTPELQLPEELAALPLPPLLLQPLVENAIKHGLEPHVDGGTLSIGAARDGRLLRLTVRDTGVGPGRAAIQDGTGFGLAQVRARLATRYGAEAGLSLQAAEGGGTRVELWLPLPDISRPNDTASSQT